MSVKYLQWKVSGDNPFRTETIDNMIEHFYDNSFEFEIDPQQVGKYTTHSLKTIYELEGKIGIMFYSNGKIRAKFTPKYKE